MAALLVCLSISTGHSPVLTEWLRMCGNVQLGSVFFCYFVLFYFSCPCSVPIGLKHLNVLPFLSRSIETLRSRDVELFKLQEKFGLDINKCFLPACLPGSLDFEKKIIMWMCFRWEKKKKKKVCFMSSLWGCGSVLCHLNEWLSILLCLCVFLRLFVFALWNFLGKLTCISDVFSVGLYTYTFTRGDPGWRNTDHKVCIVAVF